MLKIDIDRNQLADVKRAVSGIKNGSVKVITRAVNKTLTGVRTDAVQEIYNELNLTKKRIRQDFTIKKMHWSNPTALIYSTGRPVSLTTFSGTRQTKTGVSVKVKRSGSRKIIRHAFIKDVKGAKQAFRREYKGPRAPYRVGFAYARLPNIYRYPVHRLTGPRIQDIYDEPAVLGKVMEKASTRLSKALDQETTWELSRY